MLDELEIRKEIARLEYEEASYQNYARLATLYTIRAEMQKPEHPAEKEIAPQLRQHDFDIQSLAPQPVGRHGDSDFLSAIENKIAADVWPLMDELMNSLQIMNPRTYDAVMRKIDAL